MRAVLAFLMILSTTPAFAAAMCAPVTTRAKILASPDAYDIHPEWNDGSTVGLSWSLDLLGDAEGDDGEYYLFGDLIDPRGQTVTEGVYAKVMEWECDSDE